MQLEHARNKQWNFGTWQFDPASNQLTTKGKKYSITSKMTDVLLVLIIHENRPATKQEIYQQVWGNLVVSEQLIARAISDLRKLFNDNPKSPSFIETLPRKGYCWLPETVEVLNDKTSLKQRLSQKIPLMLFFILSFFIISIIVWPLLFTSSTKAVVKDVLSPEYPLTSGAGIENSPAISPNGELLAYVYTRDNQSPGQILLMDMKTKAIVARVPFVQDAVEHFSPRFSPDGTQLAFTQYNKNRNQCWVTVAPIKQLSLQKRIASCSSRFLMSVDWTLDQLSLIYTQEVSKNRRALMAMNIESGVTKQVSFPIDADTTDYSPRISPDGKNLVFVRGHLKPNHHSMLFKKTLNNETNEAKAILLTDVEYHTNIYGLAWQNDDVIFYAKDLAGVQELRQLNLTTSQDDLLSVGNFHRLDYSPVNQSIAYAKHQRISEIIRLNTSGINKPFKLTRSTRSDHQPRVSPDGKNITFVSNRSGDEQIWLVSDNGEDEQQITELNNVRIRSHQWSPQGNKILLNIQQNSKLHFYLLDVPSKVLSPVKLTIADFSDLSWGENNYILIGSCLMGNTWQICQTDIDQKTIKQLTKSGGIAPYVYGDWIYFSRKELGLWRISHLGGDEELVWQEFPEHAWKNKVIFESYLYYLKSTNNTRSKLIQRDLLTGYETILYQGDVKWSESSIDISSHGGSLYFSVEQQATDDIYQQRYNIP